MSLVVLKLGDDVSTDILYPGRFMATVLPSETPRHAFADDAPFNTRLNRQEIPPGSVIVAGNNFGCGSSREQAASALKGHGLIVAANSFARIFMQNAVNLGLRISTCPGIEASVGDDLEMALDSILNRTTGRRFAVTAFPPARQSILDAGGLIPYVRKRLMDTTTV